MASTKKLDRILDQIDNETLRAQVAEAFADLSQQRKFGLVFEDHVNESVRLPGHKIKIGSRVVERRSLSSEPRRVVRFTDHTKTVAVLDDDSEHPVADLCVLSGLNESFYPGFTVNEVVSNGPTDARSHAVIKGENYHVLKTLAATHKGKVDLIYIDPPYNTGNDSWIYNDKYVAGDDLGSSSKWLSFMQRRLLVAKELLSDTGVIFVAIGDAEHHRLRMLMDQIFGTKNFIANIIWQGKPMEGAKFLGGGVDYMLVYGRDISAIPESWSEPKPGVDEVLSAGHMAWSKSGGARDDATARMQSWWKSNKGRFAPGLEAFRFIDNRGRLYSSNMLSAPDKPETRSHRPISHPNGQPCKVPPMGWVCSDSTMERWLSEDRIIFGEDHTTTPRLKRFLDDLTSQTAAPSFERRRQGATHLKKVLGDKRFPFPKDHEVLMRWIRMAAPKDALILDFFGGSGSTAEAVIRLNAEDGGTRQCILVTNNEVGPKVAKKMLRAGLAPGDPEWEAKGVYEYVTRPRIKTIVTGVREDGSTYSEGLAANVAFLSLEYLDKGRVKAKAEYRAVAPLLWLWAGGVGPIIDEISPAGYTATDQYGVLFDVDQAADFVSSVNQYGPRLVFVVTDSLDVFAQVEKSLPHGTVAHRLYSDYLENFEFTETE